MKPEQVLPDDQDKLTIADVTVRKGTVGAFLHNARLLMKSDLSEKARRQAEKDTQELLPALDALGFFEVLGIRDEILSACINRLRQTPTEKPA